MHEMVKGANVSLAALSEDAASVFVTLGWTSRRGDGDADVSVLWLGADGRVRRDTDFYFYNNPAAPDGSVQLLGRTPGAAGMEDRIGLDLTATPADVDRVLVTASRYGGLRFGDLDDLRLTLSDRCGEPILGFSVTGAGEENAFIFGELYRRGADWKFRAVGQGYASGLAGLARDFGLDVTDENEDADTEADAGTDAGTEAAGEKSGPAPSATPAAAETPTAPAAPAPVPAPRAPDGAAPAAPVRAARTARRKITLPKAPPKSLAENDTWRQARLFPASSLRQDREREVRATSVLLSVMSQVPEFGRRVTAAFGAPAGRMDAFTEVQLPHGENPKRPDGVVRVERAGKLWTALVETKTNGNPLRSAQVQDYMDIAAKRGYEAVITLSNDVALEGSPLVDVTVDRRRKHKVALWHLSWAEVTHQAQMLIRHEGVGSAAHAWLLQELLHYLQHENSGCHGFQNMGPAWVPVRNGIDDETLVPGDPRAVEVVENWERLVRQICLRLGGELGHRVVPVQAGRRGHDPRERRQEAAGRLCLEGRLGAEVRVDGAPGILGVTADLRTGRLRTSVEVPAPESGYPLSWAKRLVRQLAEAPADLHVETLTDGEAPGPRGTLERLRPEPGDMLPKDSSRITGFRLSLSKGMGATRGNAESGFIRSVNEAVDRFHRTVLTHVEARPARTA